MLQDEAFNIPEPVDQLLSDYAKRFNEIKTPRKLLWKKNLGTVKVRQFKIYMFSLKHELLLIFALLCIIYIRKNGSSFQVLTFVPTP